MAKTKKTTVLNDAEQASQATQELLEGAVETATDGIHPELKAADLEPGSLPWTKFLMGQLTEDEVYDGRPKVNGLRRLVQKYIGTIIDTTSVVAQSPNYSNGNHSTVCCKTTVRLPNGELKSASGVADVFKGNGDDEVYSWRYSSSTAETRAKSRSYRELCELTGVVANEEVSEVPLEDSGVSGALSDSQVRTMNQMAKRMNINLLKLIEKPSVYDIDYTTAQKQLERMNSWYNKLSDVPQAILGYEEIKVKERK